MSLLGPGQDAVPEAEGPGAVLRGALDHDRLLEVRDGLLQEGGVARLYRGFWLYNLKAAPSAAVQFFTYHTLKDLVQRGKDT